MAAQPDRSRREERVFVDLIEDILRVTPGLRYHLHLDEAQDDDDRAYAVFTIETNPAHELAVSIELARNEFRLRVNADPFSHRVENRRRIDRWIEHRCRNVEQLVSGDLKVEVETLFGNHLSSLLYAGSNGRWKEIADRDDGWGWMGLLGWLLPFGLSPFTTHETEYEHWFRTAPIIE